MKTRVVFIMLALIASPLAAKDSLGVFGQWGAFRDPQVPRCYAIAAGENDPRTARNREHAPFASVGTWPKRGVRGQLHVRLSRAVAAATGISLSLGGQRFELGSRQVEEVIPGCGQLAVAEADRDLPGRAP